MKILFLTGLFISLFGLFAQKADSSHYRSRKLKLTEINFVSSYYNQDGNNSAVTGGTGTEELTDYSNQFEVKLHGMSRRGKEISWEANISVTTRRPHQTRSIHSVFHRHLHGIFVYILLLPGVYWPTAPGFHGMPAFPTLRMNLITGRTGYMEGSPAFGRPECRMGF